MLHLEFQNCRSEKYQVETWISTIAKFLPCSNNETSFSKTIWELKATLAQALSHLKRPTLTIKKSLVKDHFTGLGDKINHPATV